MRQLILIISILVLTNHNYSQSYNWISSYYYRYTVISIEFQRITPVKGGFSYQNNLSTMQSQYDAAWEQVNLVYNQMLKLELLNKINRQILAQYKSTYFKQIANKSQQLDLRIPQNKDWAIYYFRLPINLNKNIRNEIKILAKLGDEIDWINTKSQYFSQEQVGDIQLMKKNISGFLEEFENSDSSETITLLKKYDLYLMMTTEFLEQ